MAASHEYRGYLRDSVDLEATQHHRFHPVQSSDTTYRPFIIGTLAIMGLLQVASSVAILLHLTGYLQEVGGLTVAFDMPEPIMNALQAPKLKKCNKNRCKSPRDSVPSAHLPIRAKHEYPSEFSCKPQPVTIEWDNNQGDLHCIKYEKGKLYIDEPGYYYVYAKTCFRYYNVAEGRDVSTVDFSNIQLIQYICHDIHQQNTKVRLMKTGSTLRWNNASYNMYCAQQGRGVRLEQGDSLFVNVSNAWLLDQETEGTYFGAIKLGG
uniref:THD domain-containing protein n=1 Tax=Periophthalmus magnuspinnatus TaxID=409849 RepID=A0A3B3ZAC6_9GOBI